jgi:hypothetical protein
MAENPQNLAGQRVFSCEISQGNLHCQDFASFKSTNLVAKNNAVVHL